MYDGSDDDFDEGYEDAGPQEGDLTTDDHVNFSQYGRRVLTLQVREAPRHVGERGMRTRDAEPGEVSDAAMWRQLDAYMKEKRFYPNVWFISDHGNAHLMTKPKRVRKQSARTQARHRKAVASAEKRYGTYGALISGGLREHWPPSVKDKIRRLARAR